MMEKLLSVYGDWKLCLYRGGRMFFCEQAPGTVLGEGWDSQYPDCNAGDPRAAFVSLLIGDHGTSLSDTPEGASAIERNSSHKMAPWVKSDRVNKWNPIPVTVAIYAGLRLRDFVALCKALGVELFMPVLPEEAQ